VTATVTSPGGTVNDGNVSLQVGGATATGKVVNGTTTATLNLPAGFAADAYSIDANYTDTPNANDLVNFAPVSESGTLTVSRLVPPPPPTLHTPYLLALFDQLLKGIETMNADGTVTMTDIFFGIPLISTYNRQGYLVNVIFFGLDITFLFA
jgi:hypothetical protein